MWIKTLIVCLALCLPSILNGQTQELKPTSTLDILIPTNDNQGAPPAEEVEQTLAKIRELAPNARIRIGRLSDFYDTLIKEDPDLPVVKGDMPDTWIHGYMSMPEEVKTSRRIRRDMFALETLNAQMNLWTGKTEDISEMIAQSAETSLLFDEHTFGMAMSHGQSGHWAYGDAFSLLKAQGVYDPIEKSWADKGDRVYSAERRILPNYKDELNRLAREIKTGSPHITVYNPLPWARTGVVELLHHSGYLKGNSLRDTKSGDIIPFTNKDNVIRFIAQDVPAMGYKTYLPDQVETKIVSGLQLDEQNHTIENAYFMIQVDVEKGG